MKTTLKKISVWETTDGEIFKVQDEAYAHQNDVAFEKRLTPFVEKYFVEFNECDRETITTLLLINAQEIVEAYEQTRCL